MRFPAQPRLRSCTRAFPENSGWLTDAFVQAAAASVPGMDVPELVDAMDSKSVAAVAKTFTAQANADKVPGTPALYIGPSDGQLQFVHGYTVPDVAAAVRRALR
jgi:hypothetical protein